MIVLHHLEHSRSTRVAWLLEELGVPYEVKRYKRHPETMLAGPDLAAVHPLGKSPVITDGDRTLAESAAILEYLCETYGEAKPSLVPAKGTRAYDDYRYFMHYAEGSLMPQLLLKLVFTKLKTAKMPFFARPIAKRIADTLMGTVTDPNLAKHFAFLGAHLDKRPWIAGDSLTVADIQMSYPIIAATERGKELGLPASVIAYADRLKAQPGYQAAIAKAGA